MDDKELKAHVEYASGIVQLAIESNIDNGTVMNGLAIATAAMLLDMVADESGAVNDVALLTSEQAFIATLRDAVDFAKQQVEAGILITEN